MIRAAFPLALLLALLPACATDPTRGYTLASAHNERIQSVSVSLFRNDTFEPGLEAELTDAIIREIRRTTPWRVTRDAQTTLSGVIRAADLIPLATVRGTGLTQEALATLQVDFTWTHNRTGQTLSQRLGFAASGTFVPARPVGERIDHGRRTAIERLARDIVAELRSNW